MFGLNLVSEQCAKLQKYEQRCDTEAITFLPLAVNTFVGWHKLGLATIIKLGRQLAINLGKDEDEVPEAGRPHHQGQRHDDSKPAPNILSP